jgi:hypothetical protein
VETTSVQADYLELSDTVDVDQLRGAYTVFTMTPPNAVARGTATSDIRFVLVDSLEDCNPVPGHHIRFEIVKIVDCAGTEIPLDAAGDLFGKITQGEDVTDGTGLAQGVFTAGTYPGQVTVWAFDSDVKDP